MPRPPTARLPAGQRDQMIGADSAVGARRAAAAAWSSPRGAVGPCGRAHPNRSRVAHDLDLHRQGNGLTCWESREWMIFRVSMPVFGNGGHGKGTPQECPADDVPPAREGRNPCWNPRSTTNADELVAPGAFWASVTRVSSVQAGGEEVQHFPVERHQLTPKPSHEVPALLPFDEEMHEVSGRGAGRLGDEAELGHMNQSAPWRALVGARESGRAPVCADRCAARRCPAGRRRRSSAGRPGRPINRRVGGRRAPQI